MCNEYRVSSTEWNNPSFLITYYFSLDTLFSTLILHPSTPDTLSFLITDHRPMITVYYFFLLPRHDHFHDLFIVHDQLSAHVHGCAVERAGELEWRLVFVPNRRAGVGAAGDATTNTDCASQLWLRGGAT